MDISCKIATTSQHVIMLAVLQERTCRTYSSLDTASLFSVLKRRSGNRKKGCADISGQCHYSEVDGEKLFYSHNICVVSFDCFSGGNQSGGKGVLKFSDSPQNSRNFPAFTCFPCLICCKTGACRDVAVSFHIRLGYGTETRMQYVFEIGLRHTHLFNMCGKDTMF